MEKSTLCVLFVGIVCLQIFLSSSPFVVACVPSGSWGCSEMSDCCGSSYGASVCELHIVDLPNLTINGLCRPQVVFTTEKVLVVTLVLFASGLLGALYGFLYLQYRKQVTETARLEQLETLIDGQQHPTTQHDQLSQTPVHEEEEDVLNEEIEVSPSPRRFPTPFPRRNAQGVELSAPLSAERGEDD
jgi:hypothetical protein